MSCSHVGGSPTKGLAMGRVRTRSKVILGVVALLVVAGASFGIWRLTRPAQATTTEQPTTMTVKASKSTMKQTVTASGTLAPQRQAYLNFPASGTVQSVRVQLGDTVQQGQVLATQDTTTLDAAVTSAAAAVNSASSSLNTLLDSTTATQAQIDAARAQLASAQAKLVSAKNDQAGATITAPFPGVVAQVNLTANAKVSGAVSTSTGAGTTTQVSSTTQASAQIVVVDITSWQVNATVGMADLASLKQGMATVVTPTGTTSQLPATLTSIGIVGTTTSGQASFPIIVAITGNPPNLYVGGTADLTITVSEIQALTVPTTAIHQTNGQTMVTVSKNGANTEVPVKVGRAFGQLTEITEGVAEGDEIVVPVSRQAGNGSRSPGAFGSRSPGANRSGGFGGASGAPSAQGSR